MRQNSLSLSYSRRLREPSCVLECSPRLFDKAIRLPLAHRRRVAVCESDDEIPFLVLLPLVRSAVRVDGSLADQSKSREDGGMPLDNMFLHNRVRQTTAKPLYKLVNPPMRASLPSGSCSSGRAGQTMSPRKTWPSHHSEAQSCRLIVPPCPVLPLSRRPAL